jgi:tripartite-type tricarboxylate transporter receptor subunit TctC
MQHVPYPGAPRGMIDVMNGQVQLSFIVVLNTLPHIRTGRLKPVAVTGGNRVAALPQVPTFAEAGLPGFDIITWFGMTAPRGTPKEIVARLAAEIARVQATQDMKEKLASQGLEVLPLNTEQFGAYIRSETRKFGKVIKAADIKVE